MAGAQPLKLGVHHELTGLLTAKELRALSFYTRRRLYLMALAAGRPRYDLGGNPCGEVTAAEQEAAKLTLGELDAKAAREAAASRAAQKAARAAARAASAVMPKRLGLADLKTAAQLRKAAGYAGMKKPPAWGTGGKSFEQPKG